MVKYLAILVILIAFAVSGQQDNLDISSDERIVNASTPNPIVGELPYLVSISNGPGDGNVVCSGWIHNSGWVITAASCVYGKQPDQVKVIVAQTSLTNPNADEFMYNVSSLRVYPGYNNSTRYHDIALLEIDGTITFGPNVQPINIAQPEETPNSLLIAGFGASFPNGPLSIRLRKTTVTLDPFASTCAGVTPFDPVYMFCAGTNDTTGPCTWDEGSPAVQVQCGTGRVVGIVSNHLNCGDGSPTAYTMVVSYFSWILQVAGRHSTYN